VPICTNTVTCIRWHISGDVCVHTQCAPVAYIRWCTFATFHTLNNLTSLTAVTGSLLHRIVFLPQNFSTSHHFWQCEESSCSNRRYTDPLTNRWNFCSKWGPRQHRSPEKSQKFSFHSMLLCWGDGDEGEEGRQQMSSNCRNSELCWGRWFWTEATRPGSTRLLKAWVSGESCTFVSPWSFTSNTHTHTHTHLVSSEESESSYQSKYYLPIIQFPFSAS
jgi:hypothetical protein